MERDKLSRRDFLKRSSLALGGFAAGALTPPSPGSEPAKTVQVDRAHNYSPKMGYRRLGKTNVIISEIGLGGHWGTGLKNREEVLTRAAELGLNYLDTNMVSECELYGRALKGMRDKWYIGFASCPFTLTDPENVTAEVMMKHIEVALKDYGTETLDIWRPVGTTYQEDQTAQLEDRVLDTVVTVFEKARKEGKVRWLGIAVHNPTNIRHVLNNCPSFSVILFPYFFVTQDKPGDSLISLAKEKDVGVIAFKAFGGGLAFRGIRERGRSGLDRDASAMLKKVLANQGISSVLCGVADTLQLEINVRASYERMRDLTSAELERLWRREAIFFADVPPEYAWLKEWEYV
jgi:aryl-alcohol dehydrogenase-like predicted oxidoreductase